MRQVTQDGTLTEYLITYDLETNVVYLEGLTVEKFWEAVAVYDDVDDVESFAEGLAEGFRLKGEFVTVVSE